MNYFCVLGTFLDVESKRGVAVVPIATCWGGLTGFRRP